MLKKKNIIQIYHEHEGIVGYHCCRHTCISMLAEVGVDQTIIKKIVGHSGAMTLTEKVYTHFDVKELVNAINKI